MFTQTTPHGAMIRIRNAALLSWIPSLPIVQLSFHNRFGRPASALEATVDSATTTRRTVDGVKSIVAVLAVVIVATSWAIATRDPVTLELAPASTAIVDGGVTT